MEYREYAAGTRISALGFGCMRLPEIEKNGSWYIDDEKALPLLREAVRLISVMDFPAFSTDEHGSDD